jgi:Holliday junction resolvasome RuvABC ATP-dependent DNA helicase subunit
MQRKKYFFGEYDDLDRQEPTHEDRLWAVDRNNPNCPFSRFVGNDKAIKKLQAVAYDALGHYNHLCREISFSIFGPPSSGKTTLVKMFAKLIELPFVEFSPKIKSCDDMLSEMERVLAMDGVPLIEFRRKNYFELPPCVVFIDEIHAVPDSIIQSLLKATEYNDGMLITEKGKTVNCHDVCWVIATTDEGMLFDAFRSRFSPLLLTYLGNKDIAKIVNLANPEIPVDACSLIAFFNSRVPRKALEFARYAKIVKKMCNADAWDDVIKRVALDEGIDEFGMQSIHRKVIEALAQHPVPAGRMSIVVGRKKEEVEKYVLPWLMADTDETKSFIKVTYKGFELTDYGIEQCAIRGIMGDSLVKRMLANPQLMKQDWAKNIRSILGSNLWDCKDEKTVV